MASDPAAFGDFYRWDVYYFSTAGDILLPIGFAETERIPVGDYLAAGLPARIDGAHPPAVAAPKLGADTAALLAERLGMASEDIDRLRQSGAVATD